MLGTHYYRLSHPPTLSVVAPPPMVGAGNLIGEINGVEIDPIALVDVLITPALRGDQGTIVMAVISKLEPQLGMSLCQVAEPTVFFKVFKSSRSSYQLVSLYK